MRSISSHASKLSEAGERLHKTKMAAAKAALMEKQTELKRKRSVETEIKHLEMEMNDKTRNMEHAGTFRNIPEHEKIFKILINYSKK